MNYCINCGVELDEGLSSCPLCGFNIGNEEYAEPIKKPEFFPSDIILLHKKETRIHLWELSAIISFSGIIVCSIVDLVIMKKFTWSQYADTSIVASWLILSLSLLAFRKYYIILPGFLITILTMLFLFDLFSPPVDWFFGLGLPVTATLFISSSFVLILWKFAHFKGFNILAFAFFILSGFCVITEMFIDKYLFKAVDIRWSAIVAVSILPIALILLFVHYRMRKGNRLDSYFHV
jgi:hypothetical protein